METIQVTTSRGTLYKRTFKKATIASANVILTGDQLIIQDGKVVSLSGRVTKKDNTDIGSFAYRNGDSDPMMMDAGGYACEVSINKESDAGLQVEATEALLAGIIELTKEENI